MLWKIPVHTTCFEMKSEKKGNRYGATSNIRIFQKCVFFNYTRVEFEYSDFAHIIVVGYVWKCCRNRVQPTHADLRTRSRPKSQKSQKSRFWSQKINSLYTPLTNMFVYPFYKPSVRGKFSIFFENHWKPQNSTKKWVFQKFWDFWPQKVGFRRDFFQKKSIPGPTERPYYEILPGFIIWKKKRFLVCVFGISAFCTTGLYTPLQTGLYIPPYKHVSIPLVYPLTDLCSGGWKFSKI